MVLAVSDVIAEGPAKTAPTSEPRGGIEEHALFAEVVELWQWCHRLRDVDISRGEELASRLSILHQALLDQFGDAQRTGRPFDGDVRVAAVRDSAERLHGQRQQVLALFAQFVAQLRSGPSSFRNWREICDRLDEIVAQFRDYVRIENESARASSATSRRDSTASGHN
jgi:hypothetical protein